MPDAQAPIKFKFTPSIMVHNTPKVVPHPGMQPLTIADLNAELQGLGIEFLPHEETKDHLLDAFIAEKTTITETTSEPSQR